MHEVWHEIAFESDTIKRGWRATAFYPKINQVLALIRDRLLRMGTNAVLTANTPPIIAMKLVINW